jgi:APA family basic amino acid/polyamine antiporter
MPTPQLERALTTTALTMYGVGVIVGAGIYVLVGEIAAGVGAAAWAAFLGAAITAVPTALSYAELSSRYPESAGEATFAARAFGRDDVAFVVGFLVMASGVTSVAAVAHGFAGYFRELTGPGGPSGAIVILAFLVVLSAINLRGIRETTWINAACTIASVAGLVVLVVAAAPRWVAALPEIATAPARVPASALIGAVALSFYAFIGFEDLCNVAEESRSPSRSIPRALLWSLAIATVLYVLVAVTAVAVVAVDELGRAPAPLALVSARVLPGLWPGWLALVALFAVTNTALFNLVMASRVIYGMARRGLLPRGLGDVHARTRTPWRAVVLAFLLALALALTGALSELARATNVVILSAFAAVNLSLLVVRLRGVPPDVPAADVFRVPIIVPILGIATTAALMVPQSGAAFVRAGALVVLGAILHLVARARTRRDARLKR